MCYASTAGCIRGKSCPSLHQNESVTEMLLPADAADLQRLFTLFLGKACESTLTCNAGRARRRNAKAGQKIKMLEFALEVLKLPEGASDDIFVESVQHYR